MEAKLLEEDSLGVGAVYECPKKVRDLFFFQVTEAVVTTPMANGGGVGC